MHARPASHLAEAANRFASEDPPAHVPNGLVAHLKSVLGIIAADIRLHDRCSVDISGDDQQAALKALHQFVTEKLPSCDVPLAGIASPGRNANLPRPLQAVDVPCVFGTPVSRGGGQGKVVILRKMPPPDVWRAKR